MNEMIKVEINQNSEQVVSARNLYDALGIVKRFSSWWEDQAARISLKDGLDYTPYLQVHPQNHQEMQDYLVPLNIATHLCMISGGENAWKIRDYFIDIEKKWNSPDQIIARALLMADKKIHLLESKIESDKPKVLFADAVSSSKTSILIGELAKILRQNGIEIGQNRLFDELRNRGYLIKRAGSDWNMPTQKSMELGLFEIKEHTHIDGNGCNITTRTPKCTGKGQQYFINKFLTA
jgi:anti-repressor protein